MGTVARALDLLDFFTRDRPGLGLSELARASGLNKATCHRMLVALQDYGLLEQDPASRDYRIGPAVLRLAAVREETVPVRAVVQPVLADLAERTGESAHVSLLVQNRVEIVDYAYSTRHGTRVMLNDADRLPFHATSSGLAILAHADPALRESVLAAPLPAVTDRTPTEPAAVRALLDRVRADGFAESSGTFEADVRSFARPLFDSRGACVGALAVAAPAARVTASLRTLILAELARTAAEITRRWGGPEPAAAPADDEIPA